MPVLNFGSPLDGVMQTAFIVEDIRKEMDRFTELLGIGPWFLRERGRFAVQTYRGEPTEVELAIAMGYCGSMNYELIQQLNDVPSVYRDVVEQRGYGLHHFGYVVGDYAAGCAKYSGQGFELVTPGVPGLGPAVYEEHQWTFALFGDPKPDIVGFHFAKGDVWRDSGRRTWCG